MLLEKKRTAHKALSIRINLHAIVLVDLAQPQQQGSMFIVQQVPV